MNTFLLTWNPINWDWNTPHIGYPELRLEMSQNGYTFGKWSCGNNKSIQKGDRIFIIRLGVPNRGIVASGYAETGVFEGTHWDDAKATEGKKVRRIYIRFDKILDIDAGEVLPYDVLTEADSDYHWSPMSSGVSIPEDTAKMLETLWSNYN